MSTIAEEYAARINDYFIYIKGEFHYEQVPLKDAKKEPYFKKEKVWDREAEPALLTGLALYLGFTSLQDMEKHMQKGKCSKILKQARLRVEKEYEKRLHMQTPTGAIFALKSMGWKERGDQNPVLAEVPKSIRIEVVSSGPQLAASEKEVDVV